MKNLNENGDYNDCTDIFFLKNTNPLGSFLSNFPNEAVDLRATAAAFITSSLVSRS